MKRIKPRYLHIGITFLLLLFLSLFINCSNKIKDINVILISIDTLRPDHLSCYGYKRNTTPFLDKIANEGILFKKVISSSSWTAPAMASLFTSLNSSKHGVVHGTVKKDDVYNQEVLQDSLVRIPTILKEHGFFTMGFANNFHLSKKLGFAKDFDVFVNSKCIDANRLNEIIFSFKNKYLKKNRKYFLWVHYFDPHWPYYSHSTWLKRYSAYLPWTKEYASKKNFGNIDFINLTPSEFHAKYNLRNNKDLIDILVERYDSEISFLDRNIKKLFKELPVKDNDLVIITSDHGEEFFEHNNFTHGYNLYNETIRIPLIIKLPYFMNRKKNSLDEVGGIIDIFPTILDILNIPAYTKIEGESLLSLILNNKTPAKRTIVSELYKENKEIISFAKGRWKYIKDFKSNNVELFDLKNDKDESENLLAKVPAINSFMENQLISYIQSSKENKIKPKLVNPDEKTIEGLKSLGYVE